MAEIFASPPPRDRFTTNIPISNANGRMEGVGINFPRPMTEDEWSLMLDILEALKPGLVEPDPLEGAENV